MHPLPEGDVIARLPVAGSSCDGGSPARNRGNDPCVQQQKNGKAGGGPCTHWNITQPEREGHLGTGCNTEPGSLRTSCSLN